MMSDETEVAVNNLSLEDNDKQAEEFVDKPEQVSTEPTSVEEIVDKLEDSDKSSSAEEDSDKPEESSSVEEIVDKPEESSSVEEIVDKPEDEVVKSAETFDWRNLKSVDSFSEAARKRVFSFKASNNKSTYRKVEEAIAVIGTGESGASVAAILTWILNNYSTLDPSNLKVNVKRAVLKGLKSGRLVRTKASKKANGVSGSFTFPAQRIKLKAVRLDGKKYVFPILQPVASNSGTGEEKPLKESAVKRRLSFDAGSVVKSSPKRAMKKRPKRAVSEVSN